MNRVDNPFYREPYLAERLVARLIACLVLCFVSQLLFAVPAYANVGLPMLLVIWPASWILLLPVIGLEAYVGTRVLGIEFSQALKISGVGNLVSTLLGIPIAWFLLLGLQSTVPSGSASLGLETLPRRLFAVTVQSVWLIPYMKAMNWMIPAAAMVLCVPLFFMSVWIEYFAVAFMCPELIPKDQLLNFEWQANAMSYGLIFCGLGVKLWFTILAIGVDEFSRKREPDSKPPELKVIPPNSK